MTRPAQRREILRLFWQHRSAGLSSEAAAAVAGLSATAARAEIRKHGGVKPQFSIPSGRFLSFEEREQIMLLKAQRLSVRAIAAAIGRDPSTISRELNRNKRSGGQRPYLATVGQARADLQSVRPKKHKLAINLVLADYVAGMLTSRERLSPEQISARLRIDFPDDESMRVSPETIYSGIYLQGRGGLRKGLDAYLRSRRAYRRPQNQSDARRKRVPDELLIGNRPEEIEDRLIPGHWEGDLVIGKDGKSAIGTLVERTSRFVVLLHLPNGHTAEEVAQAIKKEMPTLPEQIRKSITWDQGSEMVGAHEHVKIDTGMNVYFANPHSPWERGSNENTNGLLRQYFPKGIDLNQFGPDDLDYAAAGLNGRLRKTLGWKTPAQTLEKILAESIP